MKALPGIVLLFGLLLFTACTKTEAPSTSAAGGTSPTPAPAFSHRALDELLNDFVDDSGGVNYVGLKKERAKLDQYLATLATAQPQSFPTDTERLAFWINSYNAFTLADVLDQVHGKVKSVQQVKDFFKKPSHKIAGETLSLDEIEKRGRDLKDPRIHFAVNCASNSCPKLQRAAYDGLKLDLQLSRAAREFLGDMNRGMNYDPGRNAVLLSPIFKWYAEDYATVNPLLAKPGASDAEILNAAKNFMPTNVSQFLTEKNMQVQWKEYDWSLNEQVPERTEEEKGRTGAGEKASPPTQTPKAK